jgi:hypothetical protein
MYQVEKGVPISPANNRRGRPAIVPPMDVGDSVLVESINKANTVFAALSSRGQKVTMRKQADGSYRVWRIA